MEEIIEVPMLKTKYALLSESEYLQLNEAISKAKGYPRNGTTHYANPVPEKCMEITVEVQHELPELLLGLTLTDTRYEETTDII